MIRCSEFWGERKSKTVEVSYAIQLYPVETRITETEKDRLVGGSQVVRNDHESLLNELDESLLSKLKKQMDEKSWKKIGSVILETTF